MTALRPAGSGPSAPSLAAPPDAPAPRALAVEMVLPTLAGAGMETVVVALSRHLRARGHTVGVTCIEAGGPLVAPLEALGCRVSIVPVPGLATIIDPAPLTAHLRAVAPDVVHLHNGTWLKGARAAHRAAVPLTVSTIHGVEGSDPWYTRPLLRIAARHTDVAVPVADVLVPYARSVGMAADDVVRIDNGIDTARFHPGSRELALRAAHGIPADAPVVGIVARLEPVKHVELLLDAFARVRARHPSAHLLVVGDGSQRDALLARRDALGLRDVAHFVGALPDTAPVYRALDVFVLPSHTEGTSVSILEAMASACPVVATAVGGTPALLEHGALGTLVPSGDAAALAHALHDALANAGPREARVEAALARVRARYGDVAMTEAYERLYLSRVPAMRGRR